MSHFGQSEKLFCWVEGRCCLAPADQVSNDSTTKTTSGKNIFGIRKKIVAACTRTARMVSKDAYFAASCGGFDSFSWGGGEVGA